MKSKKSLLENLPEFYRQQIHKFSSEGLKKIFESRETALKYAKKGIEQMEPESLNDEYVEKLADSMQVLARIVLEERGILAKN